MKKLLFLGLLIATLVTAGCLGTNRKVEIRRGVDLAPISSNNLWWRTPVYSHTPKDKNPWEAFVRPNPPT